MDQSKKKVKKKRERRKPCPFCNTSLTNLSRHIRRVHNDAVKNATAAEIGEVIVKNQKLQEELTRCKSVLKQVQTLIESVSSNDFQSQIKAYLSNLEISTRKSYQNTFDKYLKFCSHDKKIFDQSSIYDYLSKIETSSTKKKEIAHLKALLKPIKNDLVFPKVKYIEYKPKFPITIESVNVFCKQASNDFSFIVRSMFSYGWRVNTFANLKKSDFSNEKLVLYDTKTNSKWTISKDLEFCKELKKFETGSEYFFLPNVSKNRSKILGSRIRSLMISIFKPKEKFNIGPHCFRAGSAAYILGEMMEPIRKAISQHLMHKTPTMINHYADMTGADISMGEIIFKQFKS
jgi:hypothetical protein